MRITKEVPVDFSEGSYTPVVEEGVFTVISYSQDKAFALVSVELSQDQVDEFNASLEATKRVGRLIVKDRMSSGALLDDEVQEFGEIFPPWESSIGTLVKSGWVYRWQDLLVECIQEHTVQSDWTPDVSASLWKIYRAPGSVAVFVQPTGAHDAYQTGERVLFPDENGSVYESTIDNNAYSPTAYPAGWQLV